MSISPEVNAKTLTQLVAMEIRVQMARADVRQSQLARKMGKTEQWLSVRLRGRQAIDMNDLWLFAKALGVSVHQLLPSPEAVAGAADPSATVAYLRLTSRFAEPTIRPRDTRPVSGPPKSAPPATARTAFLSRTARVKPA